ncbi:TraB/GumN family protein [Chryseolinea lacunae]|uniref:TraB/GumN family protein n=1 Tax=Chryseolinea lacunae TaxID=2801331 RepID=A0ABS1KLF2_9BACT|nr:TraB/GumN family protein [Chryseolinea lacunae]MBL0740291.1 TraB/GumN family protein [Chryseolinea lacunae]
MKRHHVYLVVLFMSVVCQSAVAQKPVENAVFWEVSGNGLTKPSYLFGTFHLKGAHYVDSLTQVMDKFKSSSALVGELLIDSTLTMKMMSASIMKDTTLDKLLGADDYQKTAVWLKEVSGYDLKLFNTMNPMTIQIVLMSMVQQKYFPMNGPQDAPMDIYFQQEAKKSNKKLVGLETFDDQLKALFGQFTLKRQAEMLMEFVNEKDKAKDEIIAMNRHYREGNLMKLEELMAKQTYTEKEATVMLYDRNAKWMEQLPQLMKTQQTFVAVGALHLAGKMGLVSLLRKAGYTVKPLKTLL